MPAETIRTAATPNTPESPHVRISWGADTGYVQVATVFEHQHGADVILSVVNNWLEAAGLGKVPSREELNRLIAKNAGPDSIAGQFGIGFDGFHASLDDRRSANRLIAIARKGRDQAFGKDE